MERTSQRIRSLAFLLSSLISSFIFTAPSHADCNGPLGPIQLGNVVWALKDSVSACPAADSVAAGHPSRLRIFMFYYDANCLSKVGVPPESVSVTIQSTVGTLKVNDEGAKVFADDSTDALGFARVTIPSFSGNGSVTVKLWVSGVAQGTKTALVRTTDSNADGRSNSSDWNCAHCWWDLNYNGNFADDSLYLVAHGAQHWHRNVLFGTPVRRTNMCPTCVGHAPNTLGTNFSWAPHGKMLCASVFNADADCAIYLLPADAAVGNGLIPFSHPPLGLHDYDPSWSPLGDVIVWERHDHDFFTKGVPGHNPDTTEHQVPVVSSLKFQTDMSLSPDGNTIAFAGFLPSGAPPSIYTVPVIGGAPSRLTLGAGVSDDFPQWSPDGKLIVFFRGTTSGTRLYEVSATDTTGASVRPLAPSDTALVPAFVADGGVIIYDRGASHATATLDTTAVNSPGSIINYPEYTTFFTTPKMSPDGTRLALRASPPAAPSENPQLWAVRRNMSLPPQFTALGGQSLADTTALVPISVLEGLNYSAIVTASDPENDALTYSAFFLQQGMAFTPATRTFSWTPPAGSAGKKFNVKLIVTTPSGGMDAFIAQFSVSHAAGPMRVQPTTGVFRVITQNPARDRFEITTLPGVGTASLDVVDAAGRRVAHILVPAGHPLTWDLRPGQALRASPGVYFYRATSGSQLLSGKLVVVR